MKKCIYYIPAVIALLFYAFLAIASGFGSVNLVVWLFVALLFAAAVLLSKNKWWGALFGVVVGFVLIWMSFQYSGQAIDIERPLGIAICLFYVICGIVLFRKRKN